MSVAFAIPEYVRAAQGDPAAHMALMQAALDATAAGTLEKREGYAVAELFGRFALALGHTPALEPLVRVLVNRFSFEYDVEDGDRARGCRAAAHALRYLDVAADLGDERAASTIVTFTSSLPYEVAETIVAWRADDVRDFNDACDSLLGRAAAGDVDAGIAIFHQIHAEARSGMLSEIETLALAENVTRIGAATGDPRMAFALAGVMLLRRRYALERGYTNGVNYIGALSLSLLAELTAAEFPGASAELRGAITDVGEDIARDLARSQPAILAGLNPKGSC